MPGPSAQLRSLVPAAAGGEVLASAAVCERCSGSDLEFDRARELHLKGFEGTQRVYSLSTG